MKAENFAKILNADFYTGVPDSQLKALCNYLMHTYGIDPKHHVIAANGAARWMTFMGIQFQPSEIAKMAVVIVTAFILSKGQDEDGASPKAFKRIMIITCIVCGLILPQSTSRKSLPVRLLPMLLPLLQYSPFLPVLQ